MTCPGCRQRDQWRAALVMQLDHRDTMLANLRAYNEHLLDEIARMYRARETRRAAAR